MLLKLDVFAPEVKMFVENSNECKNITYDINELRKEHMWTFLSGSLPWGSGGMLVFNSRDPTDEETVACWTLPL